MLVIMIAILGGKRCRCISPKFSDKCPAIIIHINSCIFPKRQRSLKNIALNVLECLTESCNFFVLHTGIVVLGINRAHAKNALNKNLIKMVSK